MDSLNKVFGMGVLTLVCCVALSTVSLAAEKAKAAPDQAEYKGPEVEVPGTTIYGKIVNITERDAAKHIWEVSVENAATGEVVQLHLDKSTERKEKEPDPAIGDKVVVKYDDTSKHAITLVKDSSPVKDVPPKRKP